jgi:hypothetical protein
MGISCSPQETRTGDTNWVRGRCFQALQIQLPLRWPAAAETPACRKLRFRSRYVYQGWADLQDAEAWEQLSLYEILLRLIDFAPLRPVLAYLLAGTMIGDGDPSIPSQSFCSGCGRWLTAGIAAGRLESVSTRYVAIVSAWGLLVPIRRKEGWIHRDRLGNCRLSRANGSAQRKGGMHVGA